MNNLVQWMKQNAIYNNRCPSNVRYKDGSTGWCHGELISDMMRGGKKPEVKFCLKCGKKCIAVM